MNNTITPRELGIADAIPRPTRSDWRIGLVGFGGIARQHAAAYWEAGWQIVAVADPDPQARERVGLAAPDARVYESYEDLVSDANVEVVSLLTQPSLRLPVVEAAFRNRKPVLTEKPFAVTIESVDITRGRAGARNQRAPEPAYDPPCAGGRPQRQSWRSLDDALVCGIAEGR
jgi:3-hydroxyisobutyrate dehydrogenase-like beta-hydroxyacid dehydrogenase